MSAHLEVLDDMNDNLSPQQLSSFDAVKRNGHQLRILIENILEISRIESGKFQLNLSDVKLSDILEEVVGNLKPVAKKSGIYLRAAIKEKRTIKADEARIREILNNLVSNALKFTSKGGVTINVEKRKKDMHVRVVDTGIGIPEDKVNNLFQKFYQVDAKLGRKFGGTGLGLSITKQLVELQGGKIWVESKEGKGSTFAFTLPMKGGTKN